MKNLMIACIAVTIISCKKQQSVFSNIKVNPKTEFIWEAANIYFLLTDRFNNADTANDVNFNRTEQTGVLRGFKGGDIKGISQKIKEGYFTKLGINAIWMTPIVEQIHGATNEGTGISYGFHGYWAKDWTNLDPNFGTKEDLKELVDLAHANGIRILLDAVINHTGPVTDTDPTWPLEWVRTQPTCTFKDYKSTTSCTLVTNLPDILTESNSAVTLPPQLVLKWKAEGRYNQEMKELDAFFERTKYPKAPRFYIIKWLTDYITEFGIDGYRVDTVKHTEEFVWQEFRKECDIAFAKYKQQNPAKVLDDNSFYLVGEVYNYGISSGKLYDFGDRQVNYFNKAFNSLINFELKYDIKNLNENAVFIKYDSILHTSLKKYGVLNYLTSHDDGQPFDKLRKQPYKTATMLLLTPGASQVYYGDESARSLTIANAQGDATLRSFMNWDAIKNKKETQAILAHWQKLGQFRANHLAVGAGRHQTISKENGLVFSRVRNQDKLVIGINLSKGKKVIPVANIFAEGTSVKDFYSKQIVTIKKGAAQIISDFDIVLLEQYVKK